MIKLSKLTDYAVVILSEMSQNQDGLYSAATLASQTNLPEPTVSKILKMLVKANLITSERGVNGGYKLGCTANHVLVSSIISAMEGPIALTACVDSSDDQCALEGFCAMHGRWNAVNTAIVTALENVTLADMIRPVKNAKNQKTDPAIEGLHGNI